MRHTATVAILLLAGVAAIFASPAPAARAVCPGKSNLRAPAVIQERAMRCLVDRARKARGLPPLHRVPSLEEAANSKSGDIIRCNEFSHEACGREFTYWMDRFGYRGCAEGENIAWGSGSLGTAAAIFRAWMHSPGHRENILGPYEDIGIGLRTGKLEGVSGAHVWTQEFGSRHC
ncbi:MAG TPA: CAP domain-containing protein [Solirubrobacterales bacterium]|nr:CAP domain-containing protein [Solirubrobacterales bacterium]